MPWFLCTKVRLDQRHWFWPLCGHLPLVPFPPSLLSLVADLCEAHQWHLQCLILRGLSNGQPQEEIREERRSGCAWGLESPELPLQGDLSQRSWLHQGGCLSVSLAFQGLVCILCSHPFALGGGDSASARACLGVPHSCEFPVPRLSVCKRSLNKPSWKSSINPPPRLSVPLISFWDSHWFRF